MRLPVVGTLALSMFLLATSSALAGDTPPGDPKPGSPAASGAPPTDVKDPGSPVPGSPAALGAPPTEGQDAPRKGASNPSPEGKADETPTEPLRADSLRGVVVRVDLKEATATGDVVVRLGGAKTTDLKVADDGASPDVTAGDKIYSGATWLEGDKFDVSVSIGSKALKGGAVAWEASDTARDLSVSVVGDTLTAEAGVPKQPVSGSPAAEGALSTIDPASPTGGAGTGGSPGANGSANGAPPSGGASGSPPNGPPNNSMVPTESTDPVLFIGFGVGLLLLTGLIYSGTRGRKSAASEVPTLAEPGLLGPTTPSLSNGLSVWETSAADVNALSDALLATLARHHRVVVAAEGYTPPPVFGGPVYRSASISPAAVRKAVEGVLDEGGLPVAVLFRGPADPKSLGALADAVPERAGVVVVTEDAGDATHPVVQCRRGGAGWTFVTRTGEVEARLGADGLVATT